MQTDPTSFHSQDHSKVIPPAPVSSEAHVANQQDRNVKQARDRAQYVRQQKGHSWVKEWLVLGIWTLWIRPIYFAVSPNHFYHF